jgi:hypothetical protein
MEEWDISEKVECDLTATPMDRAQLRIALNLAEDQLAGRKPPSKDQLDGRKPLLGPGISSRSDARKLEMEVRDTVIAKVVEGMLEHKRESDPQASLEGVVSDAIDYFEEYYKTVFSERTILRAWRRSRTYLNRDRIVAKK